MTSKSILAVLLTMVSLALTALGQIQPGKGIRITVLGVPAEEKGRIDGEYPVGDNGTVNMPYIGHVQASGLRPEALASILQERYKSAQIYRSPTFQVISTTEGGAPVQEIVHVGGQVRKTGPVIFTRGLTLYQAVQSAGGATEFGSIKRVKLFRNGQQRQYDLSDAKNMNIVLEPNDTIEVPQKTIIGN